MDNLEAADNTQFCQGCKKYYPASEFDHRATCHTCYAINKEQTLVFTYGITMADYEEMLESQGWECAICGLPAEEHTKAGHLEPLHVDHCHETGKVRGLLCQKCNLMIGCAKDNARTLRKAVNYLSKED